MEELVIYGNPQWTAIRRRVDIPCVNTFHMSIDARTWSRANQPVSRKPGPKDVLIKVVVVGLNPKDWKVLTFITILLIRKYPEARLICSFNVLSSLRNVKISRPSMLAMTLPAL
jgi:hypothetical protein